MAKMFVHYNGSVENFKKIENYAELYKNSIVFVSGVNDQGAAIYTHGKFYANIAEVEALAGQLADLKIVKGIKVGDTERVAADHNGIIEFKAENNATITIEGTSTGIKIGLDQAFIQRVTDAETAIATEINDRQTGDNALRADLGSKEESEGTAFDRIKALEEEVASLNEGEGSVLSQINAVIATLDKEESGEDYVKTIKQEDGKIEYTTGKFNFDIAGAAATAKSEVIGAEGDEATDNTIYGAKKYADGVAATALGDAKEYAKEYADSLIAKDSDFEKRVATNEAAIAKLNSEANIEGSVKYEVAQGIASVVASAPESFDTLKEVADWIANDTTGAAAMQNAISVLNSDANKEGSVAYQVNQETLRATGAEGALAERLDKIEGDKEGSIKKAVADAKGVIDNYTINNQKISGNPVLDSADIKRADNDSMTVEASIAALEQAVGNGGSVTTQINNAIKAAIEELDATVGSQTIEEGKHVAVEVVEVDGKLVSMTVAENDIASAKTLSDEVARLEAMWVWEEID